MDDRAAHVAIRSATEDDVEGMLDVLSAVAAEGRWIATELPLDREARGRSLRASISRADGTVLVACANGTVVGELTLWPSATPREYGLGMAIAAGWRGRGIGRALLEAAIAAARAREARAIRLLVFPHNAAAIALYARQGFEPVDYLSGHVSRRNGERWDCVSMRLPLD
jgi:putative acetyltransferase